MKYFLDTEFIEDGITIELLSIGIVAENGRSFYRESSEAEWADANAWVRQNVLPHMAGPGFETWVSRRQIAEDLLDWIGESDAHPEFWGYYADYDWVVLCQLYGAMIDLPDGWPMYCRDIKQLCDDLGNPKLPKQKSTEHHALNDAQWTLQAYHFLRQLQEKP